MDVNGLLCDVIEMVEIRVVYADCVTENVIIMKIFA